MNYISRMHGVASTHFSPAVELSKIFQFMNSSVSKYIAELLDIFR